MRVFFQICGSTVWSVTTLTCWSRTLHDPLGGVQSSSMLSSQIVKFLGRSGKWEKIIFFADQNLSRSKINCVQKLNTNIYHIPVNIGGQKMCRFYSKVEFYFKILAEY